jgi:VanZ family protein
MFSNQKSVNSLKISDNLTKNTINTVSKVTKKEVKNESKVIRDSRFIVRKTAHFTLYFILGVLIYLTLTEYGINKHLIIFCILFCFIYAISDEIHQLLTHDRTFRKLDILIDTIGSSIGIIITKKISKKHRKNLIFS